MKNKKSIYELALEELDKQRKEQKNKDLNMLKEIWERCETLKPLSPEDLELLSNILKANIEDFKFHPLHRHRHWYWRC